MTNRRPALNLHGSNAFITGGASGIGLGMAEAFVDAGMRVMIADIRDDELAEAGAALAARAGDPSRVATLRLDVTDRAAFAAAAAHTADTFGPVHVLCNNAGVAVAGPLTDSAYSDWDWVLGVNLGGVINGIQAMLPGMLAHGQPGHVVNTASMSGLLPNPGTIAYTASKAAVVAMSEVLAMELAPRGIGCSAFCPGPVATSIAQAGKTRPAHLADTGYAQSDKRRQGEPARDLFKDRLTIGRMVVQGILDDSAFILTHSEFTPGLRDRAGAILAAVPDVPINPALMAAYPMLFSNPRYVGTTQS